MNLASSVSTIHSTHRPKVASGLLRPGLVRRLGTDDLIHFKLTFLFHRGNLDVSQPLGLTRPRAAFAHSGSGLAQLRLMSAHPVYAPRRSQHPSSQNR